MGKWGKYLKKYNPKWEKEPQLKEWLQPATETDVLNGKAEAYCKLCKVHIRAHHSDLLLHSRRDKHKSKEAALRQTTTLVDHGYVSVTNESKITDLRLAVFIAIHCSVKSVDHLGELLNQTGKGSNLEKTRMHRTKCSALVKEVISPSFQEELVKDIGKSDYALIVDEVTDESSSKFMGVCVRYYSRSKREMITDFLGLIQVVSCTGKDLADALVKYLEKIKLPLKQLWAVGTDGAANMCGKNNSFYTHLKLLVPHLQLVQCVCHSLHKCGEWAFKTMPSSLLNLMTDTPDYFSRSAKRWDKYRQYYMEKNPDSDLEKGPLKLKTLIKTRFLVWLPVSSTILDQYTELRGFFNREALKGDDEKARNLAVLYNNNAHLLYLTFLRTVLRDVQRVNLAFESENQDVTKIYTDLRNLVFTTARRVLQPQAIPGTSRPGMVRTDEIEGLENAFNFNINILPIDRMNFGENFKLLIKTLPMSEESRIEVLSTCAEFTKTLCIQLLKRVPTNLPTMKKLRFLTARMALEKVSRPQFDQLPFELKGSTASERDELESAWIALGEQTLPDVCSHSEFNQDVDEMDIVHFWSCVSSTKNGAGERPFEKLADAALRVLTVPLSNADIERVFSLLDHVKSQRRNRLNLEMLDSLLRLRVHLKANGMCCKDFMPSNGMLSYFNASMYKKIHERPDDDAGEDEGRAEGGAGGTAAEGEESERAVEVEQYSADMEEDDFARVALMFETDHIPQAAHFVTISSAF